MASVIEAIKAALESCGESRAQVARGSGVAESQLSRLVTGERGLSMDSAEKLADYMGLEIVVRPKRRRKGR
jgi:transcriptional regulator with XRE-family HTH domain